MHFIQRREQNWFQHFYVGLHLYMLLITRINVLIHFFNVLIHCG